MSGVPQPSSQSGARIWRFVTWTFGMGWGAAAVIRLLAGPTGGPLDSPLVEPPEWAPTILSILFFLLPFVVALVVARRSDLSVKRWGLRMPRATELLTMPLIGLAVILLATALPIAVGISDFDPTGAGEVQRLAEARSIEALELQLDLQDDPQPLRGAVVRGLLAGLLLGVLLGPVIELPWRGVVFSGLSGRGFGPAALIAAGLSVLWWLPLWLLIGVGFQTVSTVLAFSAAFGLLGIVIAWIRARTGSIIPGGVLAVTVSALSAVPRLATTGGSHLQLDLCFLAAVGLLAAGALLWPPKIIAATEENCPQMQDGEGE